MRTWILLSTFALALPLAACGDDTGGGGAGGGAGGGDATTSADSTTTTTTDASSSSGGPAGDIEIFEPCGASQTPDAEITNEGSTAFSQPDVTIPVGGIIRFAPTGPHNMTSTDDSADWFTTTSSEACIVFNVAGSFPYECSVHPAMVGNITVE
jgi:plastocyanin